MIEKELVLTNLHRLSQLFHRMSRGYHLSVSSAPELWGELKRDEETYRTLFKALGYQLHVDPRNFAWLQSEAENVRAITQKKQVAGAFVPVHF